MSVLGDLVAVGGADHAVKVGAASPQAAARRGADGARGCVRTQRSGV